MATTLQKAHRREMATVHRPSTTTNISLVTVLLYEDLGLKYLSKLLEFMRFALAELSGLPLRC